MGMIHYTNKAPSRAALLRGEVPTWIGNSKRQKYIAAVVLSAPPWVDRRELFMLHHWAKAMTIMHGRQFVLDHIVPLNHPNVCGLTVPWNIRVVPWIVNACKSDKFCPEQMEMFCD